MSSQIDRIMRLAERGWKAYEGRVNSFVYEELQCPAPLFGKWFFEGSRARELACVGCDRYCQTTNTDGFDPQPEQIAQLHNRTGYFTLSPQEMVSRVALLRVPQAAYCLNISERLVRDWIDMGKLTATRDKPLRVKAEDVALLMNDFDE